MVRNNIFQKWAGLEADRNGQGKALGEDHQDCRKHETCDFKGLGLLKEIAKGIFF